MRRRDFIAALAGAMAPWPWAAGAQSGNRRIGVLTTTDSLIYMPMFVETLGKLGWVEGRNVHIEYRRSDANIESLRVASADLVALHPDVIFAPALAFVAARTQTQTIPIVFTEITAPVERGFVASLGRPGGNVTGFTNFDPSIGSKWLGLLKEVVPKLARSATIFDPDAAPHAPFLLRSLEAAAHELGIATIAAPVRADDEVETAVASLARDGGGALVVIPDTFTIDHRQAIIRAAASYHVPTMYSYRVFVDDGGLMAYSADIAEQFRDAADYVDRILKGAKPGELPVQQPTNYQFFINLKTAKALGLTIPAPILSLAEELVE
jgi:putative tryptophan/tyrosine transport system substrate-binding protein